mgnify:CR=1 FL=1
MFNEELWAWNRAILDVFYSKAAFGQLVYLDLDQDAVDQVCAAMGNGKTVDDLVDSVKQAINFSGNASFILDEFRAETAIWLAAFRKSGDTTLVPPMLAFLAVTVMAAERMGEGDTSPNAYYKHLFDILKIADDQTRERNYLENAYRENIVYLWHAFNYWLSVQDGARGIPTAYAISHPYASIPLSQALLRATDRLKLPAFFDHFGLPAGATLSPDEMETLFDEWTKKEAGGTSAGLRNLWQKGQARAKISELLVEELADWDGTFPEHGYRRNSTTFDPRHSFVSQKLRIMLFLANRMGKRSLSFDLTASINLAQRGYNTDFELIGQAALVPFRQISDSVAGLQNPTDFSLENILGAVVELKAQNSGSVFRRDPKRIVVLSFDESTNAYREVDRLNFGQDAYVLVRNEGTLPEEAFAFLTRNARPGFSVFRDSDAGIPENWVLFEGVQILGLDEEKHRRKFDALMPNAVSQLLLAGGVRLPSYRSQTKWLGTRPPEIRALSRSHQKISVVIRALNEIENAELSSFTFESSTGTLFQRLDGFDFIDGEYQVVLYEGNTPVNFKRMYLKSSADPDLASALNAKSISHVPAKQNENFVFEGLEGEFDLPKIIGALSTLTGGNLIDEESFETVRAKWDVVDEALQSSPLFQLPEADKASCIYTGEHHLNLPTPRKEQKTIIGTCVNCGFQRVLPAWPWNAPQKGSFSPASSEAPQSKAGQVSQAISTESSSLDWSSILGVLGHSVGGAYSLIENALSGLATNAVSTRQLLEGIENLGLIEVSRDHAGLPDLWRVTEPQVLIPHGTSDSAIILGIPGREMKNRIQFEAQNLGLEYGSTSPAPLIVMPFENKNQVEALAKTLGAPFIDNAAENLAVSLPPLSAYIESTQTSAIHSVNQVYSFDFESGTWVEVDGLKPGAIKAGDGRRFSYYFANKEMIEGDRAIASSATIVKYLAANNLGQSLLDYNTTNEAALAPLGARVPGLYARPLLLCAGKLDSMAKLKSKDGTERRAHKYAAVPHSIWSHISNLLTT